MLVKNDSSFFWPTKDFFTQPKPELKTVDKTHRLFLRQEKPLISKKFDDLVAEMVRIRGKMRLTPSTVFLAEFIAKNFIDIYHKKGGRVTRLLMIETAHAAILLAAKLRERDIYCPMISHIIKGGGRDGILIF